MTADMTKDLATVIRLRDAARSTPRDEYSITSANPDAVDYIRSLIGMFGKHHATIQQNAEAALRLRALEQAISEMSKPWQRVQPYFIEELHERAGELLREWKEKGDE